MTSNKEGGLHARRGPNATATVAGTMTALVTPFSDGNIDWPRVDSLVERQINAGVDWLVPCGTTAESPTLTDREQEELIQAVLERAGGRCPVMAGTGSNSTAVTVDRTRRAAAMGVQAALLVAPYYNRPSPEGLFRHYAAVAEAVDIPLVLYNVPFRTGVSIPNDIVVRLRTAFPHIVAIKHATGSVDGVTQLLNECDIAVLSGDDALTWPIMAIGGVGLISVVSNLAPALVRSLVEAARTGQTAEARRLHRKLHDLATGMGQCGPNPVPIKAAMAMVGLLNEEFRLPLCAMDTESRRALEELLARHEVLGSKVQDPKSKVEAAAL